MGLGTYSEGSNWTCGPWVPRVPQLSHAVFREAQLPAHLHCDAGLCIQSQAGQGELKGLTDRAYRLYLELKETRGRQTLTEPARPQTLLFSLLPRRHWKTCSPPLEPALRALPLHNLQGSWSCMLPGLSSHCWELRAELHN